MTWITNRLGVLNRYGLTLLLSVFLILLFRYQFVLLTVAEWGDESETIVIAKLLATGKQLYTEVFSQHGPLTFLPGLVVEWLGDFKHAGYRTSIALGQLLVLVAILTSPVFTSRSIASLYCCVIATVIAIIVPHWYGHMYMYHTLGGIFVALILAVYTLPALLKPQQLSNARILTGNFLISCLPFFSIAYLPAAILLFAASCRPGNVRCCFLGLLLGAIANLVFLVLIGSLAGYLATHIYLNFVIYPTLPHTQLDGIADIFFQSIRLFTSDLGEFALFVVLLASGARLLATQKGVPWRVILIVLAIAVFTIRGGGFRGLPYLYAALVLPMVLFYGVSAIKRPYSVFIAVGLLVCTLKLSLLVPGDREHLSRLYIPEESEFSILVKKITEPDDRIVSYSFKNLVYLQSDRLPASGHIYYLPQQEIYRQSPKFGVLIDVCKELRQSAPKVMLIDKWRAWNRYSWRRYGGCIQSLMDESYTSIKDRPYYIRNDILENILSGISAEDNEVTLEMLNAAIDKNST